MNINKSELGRKYGVSDVVIGKDIALIMKDVKVGDVNLILKRFDAAFSLALNRALWALSKSEGSREVNDSIRTLIVVVHEHLVSLSRLGYQIPENGIPSVNPVKPNVKEWLAYIDECEREKKPIFPQRKEPLPVTYENIDFRRLSPKKPEIMSPQSQDSTLSEPDDLVPYVEGEDEEDP